MAFTAFNVAYKQRVVEWVEIGTYSETSARMPALSRF